MVCPVAQGETVIRNKEANGDGHPGGTGLIVWLSYSDCHVFVKLKNFAGVETERMICGVLLFNIE